MQGPNLSGQHYRRTLQALLFKLESEIPLGKQNTGAGSKGSVPPPREGSSQEFRRGKQKAELHRATGW